MNILLEALERLDEIDVVRNKSFNISTGGRNNRVYLMADHSGKSFDKRNGAHISLVMCGDIVPQMDEMLKRSLEKNLNNGDVAKITRILGDKEKITIKLTCSQLMTYRGQAYLMEGSIVAFATKILANGKGLEDFSNQRQFNNYLEDHGVRRLSGVDLHKWAYAIIGYVSSFKRYTGKRFNLYNSQPVDYEKDVKDPIGNNATLSEGEFDRLSKWYKVILDDSRRNHEYH